LVVCFPYLLPCVVPLAFLLFFLIFFRRTRYQGCVNAFFDDAPVDFCFREYKCLPEVQAALEKLRASFLERSFNPADWKIASAIPASSITDNSIHEHPEPGVERHRSTSASVEVNETSDDGAAADANTDYRAFSYDAPVVADDIETIHWIIKESKQQQRTYGTRTDWTISWIFFSRGKLLPKESDDKTSTYLENCTKVATHSIVYYQGSENDEDVNRWLNQR
jgi:hypothetical protein